MTTPEKRRGRPKGPAASPPPEVVDVETSRCPTCGSTDREPYFNTRTLEHAGIDAQGREYTRVVWRRTRCRACGQQRDDKTFENHGG